MEEDVIQFVCEELAKKHDVPVAAVQQLAAELEKTGATSVRFDIEELGGKGLWKQGKKASVGNGFDPDLNFMLTDMCDMLAPLIQSQKPDLPLLEEEPNRSFSDTIGLMPQSLLPNAWWPDHYGIVPDLLGDIGALRYAYFEHRDRLLILENAQRHVLNTAGHTVSDIYVEGRPEFGNLMVKTETEDLKIDHFEEVEE